MHAGAVRIWPLPLPLFQLSAPHHPFLISVTVSLLSSASSRTSMHQQPPGILIFKLLLFIGFSLSEQKHGQASPIKEQKTIKLFPDAKSLLFLSITPQSLTVKFYEWALLYFLFSISPSKSLFSLSVLDATPLLYWNSSHWVGYLLPGNKLPQYLAVYNSNHLLYHTFSEDQEFGSNSAGCFWLGFLTSLQWSCQLEQQSSQGSTGAREPPPCSLTWSLFNPLSVGAHDFPLSWFASYFLGC